MKNLLAADFYRLMKKKETYYLLAFVLAEGIVSASFPCDSYMMLAKRTALSIFQIMEFVFLMVVFIGDLYRKDLWQLEYMAGHRERQVFLSKAIVSLVACVMLATLSVCVPVGIAGKLYDGTMATELEGDPGSCLICYIAKILFIYAFTMLVCYIIHQQVYAFFVGMAVCFAAAKIAEYVLEPQMSPWGVFAVLVVPAMMALAGSAIVKIKE